MAALDGLIDRTTTAQQVADGLAERIFTGDFRPGERLRESTLSAGLRIARNTVREAMHLLELGRLVRFEINRGAVVVSPAPETVYAAREHLEQAALAAPLNGDKLAGDEAAFADFTAAAGSRDRARIVAADLAFHAAIVATLGNCRIDDLCTVLTRELRFYLMALSAQDREFEHEDRVLAEHKPLMDAIRAGDSERAQREASRHIAVNAARVQKVLAARSGGA
ncbi:GntR family transcriptional regulator [Streptomyces carpinensis]|uniref:GntR family transcriptional regulator n=1 Tax=Streptomyces carpinensis TaxID=66369 RepID=A0ABV1W7U8_9ACTN|nr:GntR family transcriptional regulator [Streptomyces carpinensis]